jgi:hypothetical protein
VNTPWAIGGIAECLDALYPCQMLPASFPRWPGLGLAAVVACLASPAFAKDTAPVIVHEWGTFTNLENWDGQILGGINVDDEPAPPFVWEIGGQSVASEYSADLRNFGLPPYLSQKGWSACDPAVTMRLETPVIYMYPPAGKPASDVPPLTVHVDFYGGVLSQYYPYAITNGLPLANGFMPYPAGTLSEQTTTGLTWENVRLVDSGTPVQTDDKVWTAPRKVRSSLLETPLPPALIGTDPKTTSQTEKFLFYRGVGHLSPALEIGRHDQIKNLTGSSLYFSHFNPWLVEIRADGSCAFRAGSMRPGLVEFDIHYDSNLPKAFTDADFVPGNLSKLKSSMHDALVKEGLFPDEATAMLKTWELSYFKSPGRRVFYIAPREWVDKVLPLSVTGAPVSITRVMICRIEMASPEQEAALARLTAGPCPDLPAFKKAAEKALTSGKFSKEDIAAFYRGEKPLTDLGIPVPPLLRDYLNLGRFRDALVVAHAKRFPFPAIVQFVSDNQLAPGLKLRVLMQNVDSASSPLHYEFTPETLRETEILKDQNWFK